jgi:hypothetical protein
MRVVRYGRPWGAEWFLDREATCWQCGAVVRCERRDLRAVAGERIGPNRHLRLFWRWICPNCHATNDLAGPRAYREQE